jgi:hypothetical protein
MRTALLQEAPASLLQGTAPGGHAAYASSCEGRRDIAGSVGFGQRGVGLGFEGLHGICTGSEAGRRLRERDEL